MEDEFKTEREKFELWVKIQFSSFDESSLKMNEKFEYMDDNMLFMFMGFCGGYILRKVESE